MTVPGPHYHMGIPTPGPHYRMGIPTPEERRVRFNAMKKMLTESQKEPADQRAMVVELLMYVGRYYVGPVKVAPYEARIRAYAERVFAEVTESTVPNARSAAKLVHQFLALVDEDRAKVGY